MLFKNIKLAQLFIYVFLKFIVSMRYKLEYFSQENIPSSGGALLLGNHVSWIDWAVLQLTVSRRITFVLNTDEYKTVHLKWLYRLCSVIPSHALQTKEGVSQIAKKLDSGDIIVVFPENSMTYNGHLGEFHNSFELVLKETKEEIPVIVFYLRGLWESMFSRANKKYIDSYRTNNVTISFSKPFSKKKATTDYVKHKVLNLTITSWKKHIQHLESIPCEIVNRMKEVGNHMIVADSTGIELSGYKFLTAAEVFKNKLQKKLQGENIALLLPTTAAGIFVNMSVLMMGKTAVNLNYTAEVETLIRCAQSANITSLITSRKFIEKLKEKGINIQELLDVLDVIYLEDIKASVSKVKAVTTFFAMKFLPTSFIKMFFIKKVPLDNTAVIMFSSGSEGLPKGIELSHLNILGNTQQFAVLLNVHEEDCMIGSLPLFHAFGLCVTTFYPLLEGVKVIAHPDPTDGYEIGKLVYKYRATMMFGTSTFYRLYIMNKKLKAEMFESLRFIVAGAEKLSLKVREDFKQKFNKEILEGYGTTETSPVASCNLPDCLMNNGQIQKAQKVGTVGMPIPGTSIKIVDPDTYEVLPIEEEGMVLIGGVQIMKGYLNDEVKSKHVIKMIDGKAWYITGDKGKFDHDGYLTIVDRYSRFAKMGGEMISLGAIEAKLSTIIVNENVEYIVTSVKDEKKGEKIVLLISGISTDDLKELKSNIIATFESKLMVPSNYKIVEEIPKLGTGKKDFAKAKALAR